MPEFGTYQLGRLTYRTAEEARGAAADLGLRDVHSMTQDGERVWMPGRDREALNAALEKAGLPTTQKASSSKSGRSGGMMSDLGIGMGMDDDRGGGGFL